MEGKRNFYFKTEVNNEESIEVYVGQSSGKQLSEDIANAQNEVLIISPYIDESRLDDLIRLKNRNVNVRIAFSDLRKDQYKNILTKLIHQNKFTDLEKKQKKEKLQNRYSLLSTIFISAAVVIFVYNSVQLFTKSTLEFIDKKNLLITIFLYLLSFISFLIYRYLKKQKSINDKMEIHNYTYDEKLNFVYLRDSYKERMFIHSKIYIIDRKIAYLGSLNFTDKGFTTNFETRVRITQKSKITELVNFVHSIFDDNYNFKRHELNFLGAQVYSEEKY